MDVFKIEVEALYKRTEAEGHAARARLVRSIPEPTRREALNGAGRAIPFSAVARRVRAVRLLALGRVRIAFAR